ncbi:putative HTH-type transcriptional regulator [Gottschalkia acidurici 9a]|uniref:HTH-type transcriptional regulator n=1 Tax=Gottschalkia acidurici (strain ATCC 7906 / DSM 604 / BCRC 14475 / CIP 104303 / KCTC 5404 / NCIMB 10678 / 9a) TaxID=1128398 RepID=K0B065_GOTA9|nr:helix-turn-helix transcriptional regulator [Gottschalkia acidurici]AFS78041.1 putative HTH-type transcriptional regulator [Gottschalkia acidurici 9a]
MNKVKIYRKKYKLTQTELGKAIGVSKDYISQIERGRIPGIETARKIAETFNTTIDDIFFSK